MNFLGWRPCQLFGLSMDLHVTKESWGLKPSMYFQSVHLLFNTWHGNNRGSAHSMMSISQWWSCGIAFRVININIYMIVNKIVWKLLQIQLDSGSKSVQSQRTSTGTDTQNCIWVSVEIENRVRCQPIHQQNYQRQLMVYSEEERRKEHMVELGCLSVERSKGSYPVREDWTFVFVHVYEHAKSMLCVCA